MKIISPLANAQRDIEQTIARLAQQTYEGIDALEQLYGDEDGWINARDIRSTLRLDYESYPMSNDKSQKGWLLLIVCRMLEDEGRLEHRKLSRTVSQYRIIEA